MLINISKDNEFLIKDFIKLQKSDDYLILDGKTVIKNYLKSNPGDHKIGSLLVSKSFLEKNKPFIEQACDHVFCADNETLKKIIGYKFHQGIMAKIPIDSLLKPQAFSTLFSKSTNIQGPLIICQGITSPENMGMIVRNCKAFGFNHLVFDEKSVNPTLRRVVRVSLGHLFGIKTYHTKDLVKDLKEIKQLSNQWKIIGTSVSGKDYRQIELNSFKKSNYALLLGSEGHGLAPEVLSECDELLKISTEESISINVGCASAIFMALLSRTFN